MKKGLFAFVFVFGVSLAWVEKSHAVGTSTGTVVGSTGTVVGSTGTYTCNNLNVLIYNRSDKAVMGVVQGANGAMGSAGYSAPPRSMVTVGIPAVSRNGYYTGNYVVAADVQNFGGTPVGYISCGTVTVAPVNYCPPQGVSAVLLIRQGSTSQKVVCTMVQR